ncbi:ankyrin repeat domain-containing protein 12 isoform X1 [Gadus macrocephalus]|uniref:ankyrin repeat domain-containing protein 12 isoform X1 n=1 Tax=Gadus macrocephalus TaxID=80720 RepID=UPI0028CB695B|nr:ankyrin repeat domain-containing protein 12 isoform X1 [Gadus macrocephalus]XP_059914627.1 ankyrin repeat domain-containing protein 12 isoform X1 [Gadus macrocephalus]
MAKPGSDRDGAMVDKQAGKKSKDKLSPFTKTPKLDRSELLGKEAKAKSSMKRKLSFTASPARTDERDSDTDDSDPGQTSEAWAERLVPPCRIYADKDGGPDKKKVKKESGGKKSQSSTLLFGYPLSERKQMALLMQMTANSPDSTPSHPSQVTPVPKRVASSSASKQKDKVNKRNERGETTLHLAAIRGDSKLVKELISLGADVNVKDFAGWTPLHEACNLGYYDVAKVLISAGAEVNTQGLDDDTPLHDASSSGHKDIVKLLLRHGGNAFQANKRGERPVDVADSQELEQLLKGELPLSDPEDSSSDSEDPPSVNPSSVDDDHMEESDGEKDSEGKPSALKASPSVSGLDEYEFKDEEEEEEDDDDEEEEEEEEPALNDRHHYRRDLRQREKEERNHVTAKPSAKADPPPSSSKSKKPKATVRVLHCSTDSSSDELDGLAAAPLERRGSPSCSQSTADALKAEPARVKKDGEQKDKGKVKRKSKGQSKNKENQEDGGGAKENGKGPVFSAAAAATESAEKGRGDEDSFKMSFSPKDDLSVHLFHLSSVKAPKLNHGLLSDKAPTPLKQENAKTSAPAADGPADAVKYNHYTDAVDYCTTEGSSTKGCKHKEKSKHQQREPPPAAAVAVDGDEGSRSPSKDGSLGNVAEGPDAAAAARKTDADGKVVKKHKLKHKEKEKHRRDYEVDRSRHRQKEARKDGHRNLEFDREFWKENFFKSDEADEPPPPATGKRDGEGSDGCPPQKARDGSPVKEERPAKDKHAGRQEKRSRDEKEKSVKKERKEDKGKEGKWSEREEWADGHGSGRFPAEPPQQSSAAAAKEEEEEERAVSLTPAELEPPQEQPAEKATRDRGDKRPPAKEREAERTEKRHPEKKVKAEPADRPEPQASTERWKEKEKSAASSSSHCPGDKSHKERENEKLRSASASTSATKKHQEESRKNKERNSEKRSERERPERDYNGGEHREKDRPGTEKKSKPTEKPSENSKPERSKEKEGDRKKKDKMKDGAPGSGSNLKSLLEEKRSYSSESSKSASLKPKEEVARTPEKERDRRERDPDRHRDKDRHRERSQSTKLSRAKAGEADAERVKSKPSDAAPAVDAERAKSKASPASRDARPKEKRLVNDDLMQTSFERMLSLKDQEIEQWHRKHLEKIKQKERERLKQRPSADPSKPKSKDKAAKTADTCLSKELLRSKSSEAGDSQSRERAPKDGTGSRTLSLDGKSLCSLSAKVMASMDGALSRSPRPDGERSGVMSRSVSMVSVASSEDSCQAAVLTPRPAEYDSDSQPPLLQSSLASLRAAQSPSAHDKDCGGLPEVPHSSWSPLSNRHETPYLRAILDEDAGAAAEDGKDGADAPENLPLPVQPGAAEPGAPEPPADPEEGSLDDYAPPQHTGEKAEGDAHTQREESRPEYFPVSPASYRDASYRDAPDKEPLNSESNVSSACGTPPRAPEQRLPSSSDEPAPKELYWPLLNAHTEEEGAGDSGATLEPTAPSSSSALSADTSGLTDAQEPAPWPCPQRDLFTATESSQPRSEPLEAVDVDREEKPSETAMDTTAAAAAEGAGWDGEGSAWDGCERERSASPPVPSSAFTHIPTFEAEEPAAAAAPGRANPEARWAPEESDIHEQLYKKSKLSTDGRPSDAAPPEKAEHSAAGPSSPGFYCRTPEHKAEETHVAPQTTETTTDDDDVNNNNGGAEARHAYVEGLSADEGPAPDTATEPSTEPGPEPTEAPPSEETQESSSTSTSTSSSSSSAAGEPSTFRPPPPADHSGSTSGCSSPQSGDSDSSGAKAKARCRDHDDPDAAPVAHPRKRKMPRASPSQSGAPLPPPGRETGQQQQQQQQQQQLQHQSLAAIVDSVKLEEIEPYQTERANPYYEYLHIRRKIEEKRKVLCSVTPQPPQYYDEYVTFNGSYLLDGNPLSKLCIPMITPPPSLPEPLKEMFKQQEVMRMKLRLQHSIEREKLIVSNEQEVLRVHYRAARTLANQTLPFSACTVLLDAEVYNMPQDVQTDDGKTSVRDRFNARQFMSWLQDVDDKFDKLKTCLLMRQQHEAAALNAVQRLEWQLKLQELDLATYKSTSIFEIPEFYIPLVEVNDDFDLTPI